MIKARAVTRILVSIGEAEVLLTRDELQASIVELTCAAQQHDSAARVLDPKHVEGETRTCTMCGFRWIGGEACPHVDLHDDPEALRLARAAIERANRPGSSYDQGIADEISRFGAIARNTGSSAVREMPVETYIKVARRRRKS